MENTSPTRVRMKYLAHIEMGQSPPSTEYSSTLDDGPPFLQGTADFGASNPTPHVFCGSPTKVAHAGDVLFSVRAPVGEINLADQGYGIGRGLCAIRPQEIWDRRFAWWALHEARYRLNFASTGSTYEAVAVEDVGNLLVQLAPIDRQRAIADYLDREVERLDALVMAKERVLQLLAEKRRALITRAITRGLDPDVRLRDSGVPWLGKIPMHWDRAQLGRFVAFITSGSRGWAEHYSETGSIFLRIGNLTRDSIRLDLSEIQYVDPPEGAEGERTRVGIGDLLFSITAYLGSIALVPPAIDTAYVNQHIALVRLQASIGLIPEYIAYAALSDLGQTQLTALSYGGTKTQLALDDIRDLWFPVPRVAEQKAIVAHIEKEIEAVDKIKKADERTIVLLKERRAALIAAAVTGQLDVRRAA